MMDNDGVAYNNYITNYDENEATPALLVNRVGVAPMMIPEVEIISLESSLIFVMRVLSLLFVILPLQNYIQIFDFRFISKSFSNNKKKSIRGPSAPVV